MIRIRTHQHHARASRRGFTLMELLISIIVIGIIMSLLMVALRGARRAGQAGADRQSVLAIKTALVDFKNRYGFAPPLLRDQVKSGSRPGPVTTFSNPSGETERKFNLYLPNSDQTTIADADQKALRREGVSAGDADIRFSVTTLPYYLAGACDVPVLASGTKTPIDGIPGPGFMAPNPDGTYKLTAGVRKPQPNVPVSLAGKSDPMVDTSKGTLQLYTDTLDDPVTPSLGPTGAEFRNRKQIAYRYYRWIPDKAAPGTATSTGGVSDAAYEDYYNIPIAVAEWSAWKTTPALRDARYAVVLPGEDGVFGDEEISELAQKMSVSPVPASTDGIRALRAKATKDNIVEIGS